MRVIKKLTKAQYFMLFVSTLGVLTISIPIFFTLLCVKDKAEGLDVLQNMTMDIRANKTRIINFNLSDNLTFTIETVGIEVD